MNQTLSYKSYGLVSNPCHCTDVLKQNSYPLLPLSIQVKEMSIHRRKSSCLHERLESRVKITIAMMLQDPQKEEYNTGKATSGK